MIKTINNEISYKITNIKQVGHVDGYIEVKEDNIIKKYFQGTNIYQANMDIIYNKKIATINVWYYVSEYNDKKLGIENKEKPLNISIGKEINSYFSQEENEMNRQENLKDIKQLESIHLSKFTVNKMLKQHFKSVYWFVDKHK